MRPGSEIASDIGRLLACLPSGNAGVTCVGPDGGLLAANPPFCELIGRTEQDLVTMRLLDLVHPDDREDYFDLLESLRGGEVSFFETRIRLVAAGGNPIWVQSDVSAVRDDVGELEYLVAFVRDVTTWRVAEDQNAQLFGFPLTLVFVAGLDGYFRRVGAGYERLLGWTERDLLSRPFFDFVHPDDLATLGNAVQEVAAGGVEVSNQEIRVRCKDGSYRWLMGNYRPVLDEGLMYGIAVDITERKRTEEALQESERRTRRIIDAAYEAFISMDMEGRVVEWNVEAERVFGWSRGEAIGRLLVDIVIPERYRAAHAQGLERYRATGEGPLLGRPIAIEALRRDGSEFPVELTISPTTTQAAVVFNAFLRDITERRQAEQALHVAKAAAERASAEAERASAAKSEFVSRMSHELRTPLNAILGFAQLLDLDDLGPDRGDSVDQILRAGQHLLQLIDELLDVARIEQGGISLSIEPVHVGETVREVLDLLRTLAAGRSIGIWTEASQFDRHAIGDRQRLKQVLMNLVSNATKYNRVGGTVTISCEPVSAGRLRIAVTDTGPGIPAEAVPRLFLPFERLGAEHTAVEGTGIGLSIAKHLVELMGGEIGVDTVVGHGSTFWVELDSAEAADRDEPIASPTTEASAWTGDERTVLYVEDNLSNLRLVERILARRPGVRLVAAMQGGLALDLAREHDPELVLLDVHLPDIDGDEVLRRLQADPLTRRIPVVVVSAEATPTKIESFLAAGARAYLTKPLDVNRLLELIDEITAGPQTGPGPAAAPGADADGPVVASASPPAVDVGAPLDQTVIDQLRWVEDGSPRSGIVDLVALYIRDAGDRLSELRDALRGADGDIAERVAHSLRGTSATFAAAGLAGLCEEIEHSVAAGNLAAASELLPRVEAEFSRVVGALRHEFRDPVG